MAKTTVFTPRRTEIPGLVVYHTSWVLDERGGFREAMHLRKQVEIPREAGPFVQTNHSINRYGVTRGIHAEPWNKYIILVIGRAFGAWVDLREGDSFGNVVTAELNEFSTVFVPRGVGNSFQALEGRVDYIYNVTSHWEEDQYDLYSNVNLGDPVLAIDWPIPLDRAVMSDRDQTQPMLADVEPLQVG